MRVLLIEDDVVYARSLARVLERAEVQTGHAANADSALTLVREQVWHAALLDLKLGEDSGLRIIEPLLAAQPGLRIVLLTGYASISTAVAAIKAGAAEYLSKPAEPQAILDALRGNTAAFPELAEKPTSPKRLEWEHIQRVLTEHDGNISATARALGLHRRSLQRKLNKRPAQS